MSKNKQTKYLLYGGGALGVILVIYFVIKLNKKKAESTILTPEVQLAMQEIEQKSQLPSDEQKVAASTSMPLIELENKARRLKELMKGYTPADQEAEISQIILSLQNREDWQMINKYFGSYSGKTLLSNLERELDKGDPAISHAKMLSNL